MMLSSTVQRSAKKKPPKKDTKDTPAPAPAAQSAPPAAESPPAEPETGPAETPSDA